MGPRGIILTFNKWSKTSMDHTPQCISSWEGTWVSLVHLGWDPRRVTLDRSGPRMVSQAGVNCPLFFLLLTKLPPPTQIPCSSCTMRFVVSPISSMKGLTCALYRGLIKCGTIGNTRTRETRTCSRGAPLVGRSTLPSRSQSIPLAPLLGLMCVVTFGLMYDYDEGADIQ